VCSSDLEKEGKGFCANHVVKAVSSVDAAAVAEKQPRTHITAITTISEKMRAPILQIQAIRLSEALS
jgi:hypothetical protein